MSLKLQIEPGKYVVAVSGGVDSMVLLKLLSETAGLELVVVHINHGIRPDDQTQQDENLVRNFAKDLGVELVVERLELGQHASEDLARTRRHEVLRHVLKSKSYNKIITAHHKDDVIETMIINLLRGTGRKGLSSLKNDQTYLRPLLELSKQEIFEIAQKSNLDWNEDQTNSDPKHLRNYVRLKLMPLMQETNPVIKSELYDLYQQMLVLNQDIDEQLFELDQALKTHGEYDRAQFIMLPIEVSFALLHYILTSVDIEVDARMLKLARNFIHTSKPGKKINLTRNADLICQTKSFFVERHNPLETISNRQQ
jgi:tRNA(Ile)-lysidine synthetase-like protein